MLVMKGRIGKTQTLSGRKRETLLPGMWRRLSYLMTFFPSFFTVKCSGHTVQIAEGKGRDWKNEIPPTIGEDQLQDPLRNLKVHKSVATDVIHPQVLRELVHKWINNWT